MERGWRRMSRPQDGRGLSGLRVPDVSIRATCARHRGTPWERGITNGSQASHCLAVVFADAGMPDARVCVDMAVTARIVDRGRKRRDESTSLRPIWPVRHRRRTGRDRQSAPTALAGERCPDLRVWRAARQRARGALRSVSHVPGMRTSPRCQWTLVVARAGLLPQRGSRTDHTTKASQNGAIRTPRRQVIPSPARPPIAISSAKNGSRMPISISRLRQKK